ncbi:hydrolase [Pseudoxanthomonas suwonensis]|nr:hydrolase [Pseudoxanthomonas suwonensis]
MKCLAEMGRSPQAADAANVMSSPLDLAGAAAFFGIPIREQLLDELQSDLKHELDSIAVYEDARATVRSAKERGWKVGICSNLALPYGERLKCLLPEMDAYSLSYAVGAIKPDPRIYLHALDSLGCSADETFFVGDTFDADYVGPTSIGMRAWHLQRAQGDTLLGLVRG